MCAEKLRGLIRKACAITLPQAEMRAPEPQAKDDRGDEVAELAGIYPDDWRAVRFSLCDSDDEKPLSKQTRNGDGNLDELLNLVDSGE